MKTIEQCLEQLELGEKGVGHFERCAAVKTLRQMGPKAKAAIPCLVRIASDLHQAPALRNIAVDALAKIGPAEPSEIRLMTKLAITEIGGSFFGDLITFRTGSDSSWISRIVTTIIAMDPKKQLCMKILKQQTTSEEGRISSVHIRLLGEMFHASPNSETESHPRERGWRCKFGRGFLSFLLW